MESEEESIRSSKQTLEFEFSEEEIEEAVKKKPGRPSNRTRELRGRLKDAERLTGLLGILDSGLLERLSRESDDGLSDSSSGGTTRVKKQPFEPEGFTSELLKQLKIFPDSFLEKNKELLRLTDTVTESALIRFGPPAVALIAWWLAEENIEGVPPILHTSVSILLLVLHLIDTLIRYLGFLGELDVGTGIRNAVAHARGKGVKKLSINMGVEITKFLVQIYFGLFVQPKKDVIEEDETRLGRELTPEEKALRDKRVRGETIGGF